MNDCVLCAIVAGRLPASAVHEDDGAIALMDIRPINPGHMLVFPRAHLPSLADVDDVTGAHVFNVARRAAAALRRSGVRCEGVNLFLADGEAAFQEVFHVHLHVVPRFVGDGFRIDARWREPSRDELDDVAARIRDAYA